MLMFNQLQFGMRMRARLRHADFLIFKQLQLGMRLRVRLQLRNGAWSEAPSRYSIIVYSGCICIVFRS